MAVSIPQVVTEDRASGALVIDGSLRFDKSKSQYLTRTPGVAGNRKKSTISYWIKRTIPVASFSPTTASVFGVDGTSSWFDLSYYTVDEIQFVLNAGVADAGMRTQASYRDFSSWYHICAVLDTDRTNDDGANSRMRVWVNGKETVQKATSSGQPAAGTSTFLNDSSRAHFIGRDGRTSSIRYGDNYLAQFYIVDGLVLGPDHFGYYDPLTNVWRPKKFTADGTTINDGRSWSGTSSVSNNNGNANGAGSLAAVFNGTMTANSSNAYGFTTGAMDFTWTPNTPIPFGAQVRVWTGFSGGTVYLNGTEEIVTTNNNAWTTLTNGRSGKITSIRFVGGSGGGWWAGVEVDGVVLVDSTTQNLDFGTNGCYLPLDGNSPIGQDQSGKGNNWTPVNFGGSTDITKATGALPILNTLGGTVARAGVFGSEVSKNYTTTSNTAAGSGYEFDQTSGFNPSLSFVRGATYTFDYTDSSSHPLRFSSTDPDSSVTSYTDGTNTSVSNTVKITVPHNAPDTLYYYCTSHNSMNGRISVTTDVTKADPYAWKCILALPLTSPHDVSGDMNCTTTNDSITNNSVSFNNDQSVFYNQSADPDGSQYFSGVDLSSWATDSPWTVEFWWYRTGANTNNHGHFVGGTIGGTNQYGPTYRDADSDWQFNYKGQNVHITPSPALQTNKWEHHAFTSDGNNITYFRDGVFQTTASASGMTGSWGNSNEIFRGGAGWSSQYVVGHVCDMRVYAGVEKYTTAGFIPASTNPDILPDTPSGVGTKTQLTKIPSSDSNTLLFPTQASKIVLGNQYTPIDGTGDYTVSFWFFASEYNSADNNGGDGGFDYILTQAATHPTYPIGVHISKAGKIIVQDSANFGPTWLSTFDYAGSYNTAHSVVLGQWSYIHVVRSSGTLSLYNNGNLQYSRSQSSSSPTPTGDITICLNTGSCFVKDLRIEGAAITDPTPPTGSPTATSNTRLLLDGLNDVSGNNVALTVTGDVERDKLSPFMTTDINTVRGQEGAYATLNPLNLHNSNNSLSEGNLKFTSSGNDGTLTESTIAMSSGKFYFEVVYSGSQGTGQLAGIRKPGARNYNDSYIYVGTGNKYTDGGSSASYGATLANGDVIGTAYDADNGTLEFFKNGISQGIAFTGITGTYAFFVGSFGSTPTGVANFGQKPFKFPPPDGFQPLTSSSVRLDTVFSRPDQYVSPFLYTGDGSSSRDLTLPLAADFLWIKKRSATNSHQLVDTVRGDNSVLHTNSTNRAKNPQTEFSGGGISSISGITATLSSGTSNNDNTNANSSTLVGYTWKAGGAPTATNDNTSGAMDANSVSIDGVLQSAYTPSGSPTIYPKKMSIGTKQGFSIVQYAGVGDGSTESIPHGLSEEPDFTIIKNLTTDSTEWAIYHRSGGTGATYRFANNHKESTSMFGGADPANGIITLKENSNRVNNPNYDYICYSWHNVPGLQRFGSFTGNGSQNFVSLDFRPAIVWVKRSVANSSPDTSTNNSAWVMMDSFRLSYNGLTPNHLYANLSAGEGYRGDGSGTSSLTDMTLEPLSNGFYLNGPGTETNANTGTYVYCAWAEAPQFNLYGAQSNAR